VKNYWWYTTFGEA